VGHEGENVTPLKHPPLALELILERRSKRKRVPGFEPNPQEAKNKIIDLTLLFWDVNETNILMRSLGMNKSTLFI
jgi:hypothetical protein